MTQSIEDFRKRFPVLAEKIYLNSCSQGALSRDVEESMLEYLRSWHKDGSPWDLWVDRYESGRRHFAQLIGAVPARIHTVINLVVCTAQCLGEAFPEDGADSAVKTGSSAADIAPRMIRHLLQWCNLCCVHHLRLFTENRKWSALGSFRFSPGSFLK